LASLMRDARGLGGGVDDPYLQGISQGNDFWVGCVPGFGALILCAQIKTGIVPVQVT
jgi:hypothetical protein